MNIEEHTFRSISSVLLAIVLLVIPLMASDGSDGAPHGTMESIWMTIDVDLTSMSEYDIQATLEVYTIEIEGTIYNVTELRDLYGMDPGNTTAELGEELLSRTMNITEGSLEGDDLEIVSSGLDLSTMAPGSGDDEPVIFSMNIHGITNSSVFLDEETLENIDGSRIDHLATGMLLSGFQISRTITLKAGVGNRVTYMFPDEFDPLGDGELTVILSSSEYTPEDGRYSITVNGEAGELSRTFPFRILSNDPSMHSEEVISGDFVMDWYQLDEIELEGTVCISSIDLKGRNILDDLPGSIIALDHVGSGLIGWAYLEGLLDDQDMTDLEEEVADEVNSSLSDALDGKELEVITVVEEGSLPTVLPGSGNELKALLDSNNDIRLTVNLGEPVKLDVLKGYELEDVMDLIHGGLRIRKEISAVSDDRFDVLLTTPVELILIGETQLSQEGGRSTYELTGGIKEIGSTRDPGYDEEEIAITSMIDLTDISSSHISDLEMTLSSESTISISVIQYDANDLRLETDLDYTIRYLSADMIRLLLKMGIAKESDITDDVKDQVVDLLGGLVDEEDLEITITLDNTTTGYVSDGMVDGGEPIKVKITAGGSANPLGSTSNSMQAEYIPHHMDPMIPIRTIQKTIDFGPISGWEADIEVHFPSGTGVQAWIGNSTDEKAHELDVEVIDNHPVLKITPDTPEGESVLLELEIGPYFGFNHVTLCFFSFWIILGILVLIIVLLIIRGLVKRKKKSAEEKEGSEEEIEDNTDEKGVKKENKDPPGGSEKELSW
ncbi:MAG: hypothetical protein U9R75_07715 [Candidatus Thermoplasmatota archaeon]|nr:hypothetical protein [Candidatus Thermoplasmatota archaeon]